MLNDKLAVLMTRHLTKEASGQEENDLLDLLTSEPEQQYLLEILSVYWNKNNSNRIASYEDSDEHFRYIIASAQKPYGNSESPRDPADRVSLLEKVKIKI